MPERSSGRRRSRTYIFLAVLGVVVIAVAGLYSVLAMPIVKERAFDGPVLERLRELEFDHETLRIGDWRAGLLVASTPEKLVFLRLEGEGGSGWRLVAAAERDDDGEVVLDTLALDVDGLSVLADESLAAPLRERLEARQAGRASETRGWQSLRLDGPNRSRLLTPLPGASRVFGVATNFRSHLEEDLALPLDAEDIDLLRRSRARVFRKHPSIAPPWNSRLEPGRLVGAFGGLHAPRESLMEFGPGDQRSIATALDYEVELGVIIGRDVKASELRGMSDDELRSLAVGVTLLGDAKIRDPQAIDAIRLRLGEDAQGHESYRIGDQRLDEALGAWSERSCRVWSYAAGVGDVTSVGPFLVENRGDRGPMMLATARSYTGAERAGDLEVEEGSLYLRQADGFGGASGGLIWDLPAVLRSLAAEDSALPEAGDGLDLKRGDLIATGTPGGCVITVPRRGVTRVMRTLLFWWTVEDFHRSLLGSKATFFLQDGDELMLWGSGLGVQHLEIHRP